MQTFLVRPEFDKSLQLLDPQRLGKQRLEAFQLWKSLIIPTSSSGWKNHPARKMWKGYEDALALYYNQVVIEWQKRGYHNTMPFFYPQRLEPIELPPWVFNQTLHLSHQSNLVRKNPQIYTKIFGALANKEYEWPEGKIQSTKLDELIMIPENFNELLP